MGKTLHPRGFMFEETGHRIAERAEAILRALPNWFGIEASILEYAEFIASHPVFFIEDEDENLLGFIALGIHSPHAAEVHVMAVAPDAHRQGIGRRLLDEVQRWCREQGIEYLQVKTLASSREDRYYAQTRQFYEAMGFRLLEVFPTLWDPHNPCALYVKAL